MFIRITPFLRKFSQKPELSKGLEEEKIKKEWQKIIKSINKSAEDKSEALYINERGELIVRVRDHLWLQELSFYKEEINKIITKNTHIKSVKLVI